MKTYRIIGKTNGWIAQRDLRFKGKTTITLATGLTLKDAQQKMLQFFNDDYETYYSNWGFVRRNRPFESTTNDDGTRSYEYDGRQYYIEQEKYIIRDRETGTEIDEFDTYEEAENELIRYEETDKNDGNYTIDFYEIVSDSVHF